jgi:hypothetical protein
MISNQYRLSRRFLLSRAASMLTALASASASVMGAEVSAADARKPSGSQDNSKSGHEFDGEILGQGAFRYRAHRHWGLLDPDHYPVRDCHGITEDRAGRVVTLTNHIQNNLIAYSKAGVFHAAWENRFPGAHGFEITDQHGEDRYWITDHDRQVVSMCTSDGRELRRLDSEVLKSKYPDMTKYQPTNTAIMPDGDFFVSDGYGSSFVHHFDPEWRYISSFGGEGDGPTNFDCPHAVWIDTRSGKPLVLVCDRGHNMLKWFSPDGELLRIVKLTDAVDSDGQSGPLPANVAQFGGYRGGRLNDHLAIACLNGMILILDGADHVVSVVGGKPPAYVDGNLLGLEVFNYTLNHPHDVYADASGALYVAQWWSNQTYPIKLELLSQSG